MDGRGDRCWGVLGKGIEEWSRISGHRRKGSAPSNGYIYSYLSLRFFVNTITT